MRLPEMLPSVVVEAPPWGRCRPKETAMGLGDKISNAAAEKAQGHKDQVSANIKQAGEKVKDALK